MAAYGGATVYAIYEYESGDKEKGIQDLKTIGLSAVTTLGALGAQGNIIGGSTTGMTMQPDGSAAVNGGQLIGYTLTLEGAAASNPAISEALGITQSAIVNGGDSTNSAEKQERIYKANDGKHKEVSHGDISADPFWKNKEAGQKSLNEAYSSKETKQLYNVYEGKLVKFQPDNTGTWHAYEVNNPAEEVPTDVLRNMRENGLISKAQYNKWIKNK